MAYRASLQLRRSAFVLYGARRSVARSMTTGPSIPVSNEERARAYLKTHGLGIPDANRAKEPAADAEVEVRPTTKRLPAVRGAVPSSDEIQDLLVREGGGLDVLGIDVSDKASFTNSLVLCTGHSPAHLNNMAARLVNDLKDRAVTVNGDVASLSQGRSPDWLVVDAGLVVTHFFLEHTRKQYALEELWLSEVPTLPEGEEKSSE